MKPSANCVALVRHCEGCRLEAYPDPGPLGWELPTIGYGHTGPDVARGLTITAEQATDLLRRDLDAVAAAVSAAVQATVNQNQFDALCSFTFNLGIGRLRGSLLLRLVNAGTYTAAAKELERWTFAGGVALKGLVIRRAAERALFERPWAGR